MLKIKSNSFNQKQTILIICLIGLGGLLIRLIYFPYNIPITADGLDYFSYAIALSRGDVFPDGYLINKFGWPVFLAPFFAISNSTEMIEFMNIQRILSIIISVLTIIPLYYLIKNFFKKEIAIVAASLFIFSPKIIENSILGITDPLFIFCISLSIMFIFVKKSKYYFLSYIFAGLAFVVRQEGMLMLIPIIIYFIIKKDFGQKIILKFGIGLFLFFIIAYTADHLFLSDMDGITIFDTVMHAIKISDQQMIISSNETSEVQNVTENVGGFLKNSLFNYSKFLIWILLPNFICFLLFSIITINKKISINKITVLSFLVILSLISLFAYGKGIQETRYLFILIPLFCLFSGYGINYVYSKIDNKILLLIIPIIISSALFLYVTSDNSFENESYEDAKILTEFANGTNDYDGPSIRFYKVSVMYHEWPELLPIGENRKIWFSMERFSTNEYQTLKEFIFSNYKKGLTHLIIYEKNNSDYLDKVFINEKKYPYLEKIYNSDESNHNQVKIFQINHIEFEKLLN